MGLTAFVFVRRLGCIFCREQVNGLRAPAAEIAWAGVHVVIVTPATAKQNDAFARDLDLPYPVQADPERSAYLAYGFVDGRSWQLQSPRIIARGLRSLTSGAMLGRPVGNSRQLPSAAIIDADGRRCFLEVAADAADHLTSEDLLWETAHIAVEDSTSNHAAVMT